jgi:hypothetical protein
MQARWPVPPGRNSALTLPTPRTVSNRPRSPMNLRLLVFISLTVASRVFSQSAAPAPAAGTNETILFVGNSFIYGAGSAVRYYRATTVTDLNGEGQGGVPALFKVFANQAGLDFTVSLETVGGSGLDLHVEKKADVIGRPWDRVVLLGQSMLDNLKPGDTTKLVAAAKDISALFSRYNPRVDLRLVASWSRADQTYPENGAWHGKSIETMALDVRRGCDLAAAGAPLIRTVIPVGEAWNRAIQTGVADANPYDGIAFGQVDLWTNDHYHASSYGYYLEALMIFGDLTGLDPRSLGSAERAAGDLGFSTAQATALQKVAFDELTATKGRPALKAFTPAKLPR